MRKILWFACIAALTGLWFPVLRAAEEKKKDDLKGTSERLQKAAKSAPRLRGVADKDTRTLLREEAQKIQAQWAKMAAERAAKAAEESARTAQEIKELRKEILTLRRELAQLQAAPRKSEAAPRSRPAAVAKAELQPKVAVKATPVPAAAPKLKAVKALAKSPKKKGDAKASAQAVAWAPIDLSKHFNNDGITYRDNRRDSDFDQFRQSYVAELLPEPGVVKPLADTPDLPFIFPAKKDGAKNNLTAKGQRIPVPKARYNKLYVMGAAVFGEQMGDLTLVYEKRETTVTLKLSDWCAQSKFGEARAYSMTYRRNWKGEDEKADCSLWVQTIDVSPTDALTAIVLPQKPMMHLFAMTLAKVR